MTFDIVLMNPPYDNNLHMKFLERLITFCDVIVNISPSDRFTNINCMTSLSTKIAKHIDNMNVISSKDCDKIFDIWSSSNLGIMLLKRECDKIYQPKHYEFIDIIKKIRKVKSIRSSINYEENPDILYVGNVQRIQGNYGYAKSWHYTLQEIFRGCPKHGIKFDTIEEQNNFVESVMNCWPYKLMYIIDDNAAVIAHLPYMQDYTHKWTDEMFYQYFDVDDELRNKIELFLFQNYKVRVQYDDMLPMSFLT